MATMDIARWLDGLGLGEYASAFADNRIRPDLLAGLTDADLRELGVRALGDRKRLLDAIARLGQPSESGPLVPAEGERRQVTVLFADIAGFTALSGRLGAERTHELLNRFFEAADGVIAEFGGTVDKHIGDNVMGVFGAPVAHENDPERAIRAGLAIHEEVCRIDTGLAPLRLHIGIASGQVVASRTGSDNHRAYTVTGDSVNLAARLQDLAGPGETLVSEQVHRHTDGLFVTRPLGPRSLKGIEREIAVWRIEGAVEGPLPGGQTRFVGRQGDLAQCRAILDGIVATGHGQTVLLRGAAGIGKTRLAAEVAAAARRSGFDVHRCLVLDFGSRMGQETVPALVRSLLGLPPSSTLEVPAGAADRALSDGPLDGAQRVFLNDLLDLPQPVELRALYDAMDEPARRSARRALVTALAAAAARTRPQFVLVEDLHWAKASTLDILGGVVEATRDHPLALLATTRPEGDPLEAAWRTIGLDQAVSMISLGPLRPDEAQQMADGFAQANRERLAECLARAAGNPLFLEQLLRNAAESAGEALPGSIQSLVLTRMDRLERRDKLALQAASVFGQRVPLAALHSLIGSTDYDCAALLRHQLLRPEGEDFLFAHALIRDGVYESMLGGVRSRLHLKAAEWFEAADPVLRAEHLVMAGDPRAARALHDAARAEMGKFRYDQAIMLLEKGRNVAVTAADRVDLALALGEAQHDTGALEAARHAFGTAIGDAVDDVRRCRAWLGLAGVKRITDDLDGALADLDAAREAARRLRLAPEQGRAHCLRGNVLFPRGDIEGCIREHGNALVIARAEGLAGLEADALGGLADGEYLRGRFRTACDRFTECVDLSRKHGFGRTEVANLPMIAITALWSGDAGRALEVALEAIESARRVGHGRAEMVACHAAFLCHAQRLEFDAARRRADRAIELARGLGARRFEAEGILFRAEIDFREGDCAAAIDAARAAVRISRGVGLAYMGPTILGGLALVTDDEDERRAALDEAEALLAAGSVSHNHVFFRYFAIDALLSAGQFAEALRHADALAAYTPEAGLGLIDFYSGRGRALARAGLGERSPELAAEVARLVAGGEAMNQFLAIASLRATAGALEQA